MRHLAVVSMSSSLSSSPTTTLDHNVLLAGCRQRVVLIVRALARAEACANKPSNTPLKHTCAHAFAPHHIYITAGVNAMFNMGHMQIVVGARGAGANVLMW